MFARIDKKREASHIKSRKLNIECMEERKMMAGDVMMEVERGTLLVQGTEADETITVTEERVLPGFPFRGYQDGVRVTVESNNGTVSQWFDLDDFDRIRIDGMNGDDTITNETAIDAVMAGGNGDDTLLGGHGDDTLEGGWGDDQLDGGSGDDVIYGGFDGGIGAFLGEVYGDGEDTLIGGYGNDELHGGGSADEVYGGFRDWLPAFYGDLFGDGEDTLFGGSGDDHLYGGGSDDELNGGSGNDELDGGRGDDTLRGNSGADELFGRNGDDMLLPSDNLITGDGSADYMEGGSGADLFGSYFTIYASGEDTASDIDYWGDGDRVIGVEG